MKILKVPQNKIRIIQDSKRKFKVIIDNKLYSMKKTQYSDLKRIKDPIVTLLVDDNNNIFAVGTSSYKPVDNRKVANSIRFNLTDEIEILSMHIDTINLTIGAHFKYLFLDDIHTLAMLITNRNDGRSALKIRFGYYNPDEKYFITPILLDKYTRIKHVFDDISIRDPAMAIKSSISMAIGLTRDMINDTKEERYFSQIAYIFFYSLIRAKYVTHDIFKHLPPKIKSKQTDVITSKQILLMLGKHFFDTTLPNNRFWCIHSLLELMKKLHYDPYQVIYNWCAKYSPEVDFIQYLVDPKKFDTR